MKPEEVWQAVRQKKLAELQQYSKIRPPPEKAREIMQLLTEMKGGKKKDLILDE